MSAGCTLPACGPRCSGTADAVRGSASPRPDRQGDAGVRKWSRKNSLSGVKLRSEMDATEASVLRSLVAVGARDCSRTGRRRHRRTTSPHSTGMRTGNTEPPDGCGAGAPAARLPPPERAGHAGRRPRPTSTARCAVCTNRRSSTPSSRPVRSCWQTVPESGGKVAAHARAGRRVADRAQRRAARAGHDLGIDADTPDDLEPDDPRAPHLDVYHWLTWMQDSLRAGAGPVTARSGHTDSLTDVVGLRVGHHHELDADATLGLGRGHRMHGGAGSAAVRLAAVDVRGGGPGTRETDLLDPRTSCSRCTPSCSPAAVPTASPPPTA